MLFEHAMRGSIFENWVILERMKAEFNHGKEPPFYFWRDVKGHEVDLVIDMGEHLYPVEIKSGVTFHPDFLKDAQYLEALQKNLARTHRAESASMLAKSHSCSRISGLSRGREFKAYAPKLRISSTVAEFLWTDRDSAILLRLEILEIRGLEPPVGPAVMTATTAAAPRTKRVIVVSRPTIQKFRS